jgi:hypothetical protein
MLLSRAANHHGLCQRHEFQSRNSEHSIPLDKNKAYVVYSMSRFQGFVITPAGMSSELLIRYLKCREYCVRFRGACQIATVRHASSGMETK